jgi:hypothetical protein
VVETGESTVAEGEASPEASSSESTRYDDLPENPELDVQEEPSPSAKRRRRVQRLDLGLGAGVSHLLQSESEVTLDPGPVFFVHARIAFNDWLGLSTRAAIESHGVSVASEAFGFQGLSARHGSLRAASLSAALDPRFRLGSQWFLHAGLGLGWTRLEAGQLEASEPYEFTLDPRTGVLLEATLAPRLSFHWTERVGVSLWGRGGLPLLQSGDVFASGASELQTVRRDDGQLLSVGGYPDFSYTLAGHLSVDVFF